MKTNFIKVAFVAVIALACGINVFNSQKSETMSEIALNNVEALADKTNSAAGSLCYKGDYNSSLPEATKCANPCVKERCGGEIDVCYQ